MIIKQNSRISLHRLTDTGTVFTIPSTEDFTNGTWLVTDLALGEIGIQLTDDRAFFRTVNGLVELMTTSSISGLWERVGEDIVAIENGLTSPLTYPAILPPANAVSDLGSTSLRWDNLYLGGANSEINFKGVSGYTGSEYVVVQAAVQTTTTALTVMYTLPTLNDGESVSIRAMIVGQDSSGTDTAGGTTFAVFRKKSGTVSIVGTNDVSVKATGAQTIEIQTDGTNVRVRVKGVLGTQNWIGTIEYTKIITNA